MKRVLLLHSHCIIIRGNSRSTICDLQRNNVHLIPNTLTGLFINRRYLDVERTLEKFDSTVGAAFEEYITFLTEHELAFNCSYKDLPLFPDISEEWLFPAHITHCVLDGNSDIPYFDSLLVNQLCEQLCTFLQFRFFQNVPLPEVNRILNVVKESPIRSVEIILPVDKNDRQFYERMGELVSQSPKISMLIITAAERTEIYKEGVHGMGQIVLLQQNVVSHLGCGIINPDLFSVNIPTYTESLHHNTCLHRKISIDTAGNIKNCPSMKESFGNIKDTTLQEALNKPGFKKYWNITKDQISVCKDCEFRHVCTDCRAYLENPEDDYSKPLKCGYNPYTCEWEEWSIHPMKQKAIAHYGLE